MAALAAGALSRVRWWRRLLSPRRILPRPLPPGVSLTRRELRLLVHDPWYHDFSILGYPTPQLPGIYGPNQACKQGPIFDLTAKAICLCRQRGVPASGVELFCADGFYSNYAASCGATRMDGLDIDGHSIEKARLVTRVLGNAERVRFEVRDVFALEGAYEFGICAGGLYHISNPQELLEMLARRIRSALVIQTVYSLANSSPDYFETPAPRWTWGCRFSHGRLLAMVAGAGWEVVESRANELAGNNRPDDRGSACLLCVPRKAVP